MKRLLLSLALTTVVLVTAQAEYFNYLTVTTDCCTTDIPRTEVRKLTFEAGNLVVTKADGSEENFGLTVLKSIAFTPTLPVSVRSLNQTATSLHVRGNSLVVAGKGILLIYDTMGRVVRQESISTSRYELNICDLSHGLYVARLGNQTLKFTR